MLRCFAVARFRLHPARLKKHSFCQTESLNQPRQHEHFPPRYANQPFVDNPAFNLDNQPDLPATPGPKPQLAFDSLCATRWIFPMCRISWASHKYTTSSATLVA
jgi:hypothetical protein